LLERLPPERTALEPDYDAADSQTQAALRTLSLADQRVLTLCVLEGLSEREAADALGVPTGTVKSRLSRAKARLRGLVHDHPNKHEYIAKRVSHEL
jgi:RNA polymerase sigma factor (sigma-70 family)